MYRNCYCSDISINYLNKNLLIFGWIISIRNYGYNIFINLKDKRGIIQLVFINYNKNLIKKNLKLETCIFVKGFLTIKDLKYFNIYSVNGYLEIYCYNIYIVNNFLLYNFDYNNYFLSQSIRLANRYLDLRSNMKQNNLKFRYNFIKYLRNFFNKEIFVDIETPFLTKSTPEGSRDFLIPSRIYKYKFFALPQSPQIFKQLLMISWFDKYYQITKCFRDEDYRKNRQAEFTQIDCELSFYLNFDIMLLISALFIIIFKYFIQYNFIKFLYINCFNCLKYFYSDKPDLKYNIKWFYFIKLLKFKFFYIKNYIKLLVFNLFNGFKLFGNNFKNFYKFIDKNINLIIFFFIKRLYFSYYKFFFVFNNKNILFYIKSFINYELKDLIFVNLNKEQSMQYFIFFIYNILISNFGVKNNYYNHYFLPIWVIKFSLFNYKKIYKIYDYCHNPFSSPLDFDKIYLDICPVSSLSKSYDIVVNANEIGGGSNRNDKFYIQKRIFYILNYVNWEFNFDFFINALKCSPPIHSGIALGVERFLNIFLPINSIRDVIAFPKSQKGFCILTDSPNYLIN